MKPMSWRHDRGFTLIEVLVALMILSAGIIVLGMSWSGNFQRMRKTTLFNNVGTLLERKMIEMEAKYKDKPLAEIPEEDGGDFGADFKQYRWTLKSKDLKMPDLTPLLVNKDQGADETLISMIKQVSEYLNQTIKEVKVTVYAKSAGGKEVEFSAVQYFIDYAKDFGGIPGVGGAAGGAETQGGETSGETPADNGKAGGP